MKIAFISKVILLMTIFLVSDELLAQDVECPTCSMIMHWTGKTKQEWGKLFKLYNCPYKHAYWIEWKKSEYKNSQNEETSNQRYQSRKNNPSCPVCEMETYWTGKTRTEWDKLQKIYKCPSGHLSVGNF